MKLYRILTLYIVVLMLLTLTLISCGGNVSGYSATATFGAIEYYAQLTAIAGQETPQP